MAFTIFAVVDTRARVKGLVVTVWKRGVGKEGKGTKFFDGTFRES